jgi:hypothetical protein
MRRLVPLLATAASGAMLLALACDDPYGARMGLPVEDDDASTPPRPRTDAATEDPDVPVPLPPDSGAFGRVLAHTGSQLFRLEPEAKKLTSLGAFTCLETGDEVLDIAVDRKGAVFATSYRGFLTIDPLSAACTYKAKATDYPNSLSFVPVGTVDLTQEALVGYAFDGGFAQRYVRIDTVTGAMTTIGNLNPPSPTIEWVSSGDLVGLVNDGSRAYLTVRMRTPPPDAGVPSDRLAEINPASGIIKRIIGETGQSKLYGFGYWAGKGYGFADDGTVAEIDMKTGAGKPLQLNGVTTKQRWYGAGVSTEAPVR